MDKFIRLAIGPLIALLLVITPGHVVAQAEPPTPTLAMYSPRTLAAPAADEVFAGESWDLSVCDLQLKYTIDLSQIQATQSGPQLAVNVGIQDRMGGLRAAMTSGSPFPNAGGPDTYDINDKHNLGSAPLWGDEAGYDAAGPDTIVDPFGNYVNYGVWFDRTGMGLYTNMWGAVRGKTYDTHGKYDIELTFHAISGTLTTGTVFATINGTSVGFYNGSWQNGPPEYYPAGKSFTTDVRNLYLALRLRAPDASFGSVYLTNIVAYGCLSPLRYYIPLIRGSNQAS
jgi:hypothetical protein